MKLSLFSILFLLVSELFAQSEARLAFPETDSLYREDQLYIGATFHIIGNRPAGVTQSGFSGGLHLGFIRDMPFTKKRNWALGLGLGYSINRYNQNLLLFPNETDTGTIIRPSNDDDNIDNSNFVTHLIEVPLELRWRTSTPETYKFWRIYAGMRFGYMNYFESNFTAENGVKTKVITPDGLDRLRLGATLTFGWNTFNFHVYYSLNNLFDKSVVISDQNGGISIVKLGLMFYIL